MILFIIMMVQNPGMFFGTIDKIDTKFRQLAEWILK